MKLESTIEEKTDLYLANELSTEDKTDFESLIANDETLRADVELMRHIATAFERRGEAGAYEELSNLDKKELKALIENVENRYKPANMIRRNIILVLSAVAAAIILIFMGLQPQYSSANLYAEFHTIPAYESLPPSRGGSPLNTEQEQDLDRAIEFYNRGKFAEATIAFNQAAKDIKQEELPDDMVYYWAISLNEVGHSDEALHKLEYLSKLDESEFREDAMWQQALVLLKTGDRENAMKLLSDIVSSKGIFSHQAEKLLEKTNIKRWF